MSNQYDNTDTFILFRSDKEGNEKRPDYTGTINIDGTEYRLAAWIKDGRKGKFMTGKIGDEVEGKQSQSQSPPQSEQRTQRQAPPPVDQFDDDIPF